jgi:hypothetical protein
LLANNPASSSNSKADADGASDEDGVTLKLDGWSRFMKAYKKGIHDDEITPMFHEMAIAGVKGEGCRVHGAGCRVHSTYYECQVQA